MTTSCGLADRCTSESELEIASNGLADRYMSEFELATTSNGLADRYTSEFELANTSNGLADHCAISLDQIGYLNGGNYSTQKHLQGHPHILRHGRYS